MDEPTLEELAYKARNIPVIGTKPGDLVMIADETLLASEFEGITTKPMKLGDAETSVVLLTFKGVLNNDGRLKAVTLMILPEMLPPLIKNLRHLFTQIPIENR